MSRDIDRERRLTELAAATAGVEAAHLCGFAEGRAGTAAVRDHATRDLATETLEELADARNYLVWWHQRPRPTADDALELAIHHALATVALAYDQVRYVQDLELRHAEARP
jgi:hypothetical protein